MGRKSGCEEPSYPHRTGWRVDSGGSGGGEAWGEERTLGAADGIDGRVEGKEGKESQEER